MARPDYFAARPGLIGMCRTDRFGRLGNRRRAAMDRYHGRRWEGSMVDPDLTAASDDRWWARKADRLLAHASTYRFGDLIGSSTSLAKPPGAQVRLF